MFCVYDLLYFVEKNPISVEFLFWPVILASSFPDYLICLLFMQFLIIFHEPHNEITRLLSSLNPLQSQHRIYSPFLVVCNISHSWKLNFSRPLWCEGMVLRNGEVSKKWKDFFSFFFFLVPVVNKMWFTH